MHSRLASEWFTYKQCFIPLLKDNTYVCGHLLISYNIQFCLIFEYVVFLNAPYVNARNFRFNMGRQECWWKLLLLFTCSIKYNQNVECVITRRLKNIFTSNFVCQTGGLNRTVRRFILMWPSRTGRASIVFLI